MKTANKQIEILLPKAQELTLLGTPQLRAARRWPARLHAALAAAGWLLRAPTLVRTVAPGRPGLPEHEWRARRPQRWNV